MPTVLWRKNSGIRWCRTVIEPRPEESGFETEIFFEIDGNPFSVALDNLPEREFLEGVRWARSLVLEEISFQERNWIESGRYRLIINDYNAIDDLVLLGDSLRYGPTEGSE